MKTRGEKKPKNAPWDTTDPQGMGSRVMGFRDWMQIKNFSAVTIETRDKSIRQFTLWAEERGITRPAQVTRPILERYQRYLYHYRKRNGDPLSPAGILSRLRPLQAFFSWLAKKNYILSNPAADLELPKTGKRLPRNVLTPAEAEIVLSIVNIGTFTGVRDRAILETFYSTGMRRMELIGLKLFDIDMERGTVMIREGKGRKDRVVPIGDRALAWINKYLLDVRPAWVVEPDDGTIFLTREGEPLKLGGLTNLAKCHVQASGIGKKGACHLFRHTMATAMLEGGADTRYIQSMLGHASLATTEIYTQVSIRKLKEIFMATHPAARLERKAREELMDLRLREEEKKD